MFQETFHHEWYPFQNQAEIDRVRKITKEDIIAMNGKHPNGNPNIKLEVVRDAVVGDYMVADMVQRIVDSDRYDQPCNLVMCNPCPTYITVAHILQRLKVNMRNVKFFMMDEWADEDGNIAPLSYKAASRNGRPAGCHPGKSPGIEKPPCYAREGLSTTSRSGNMEVFINEERDKTYGTFP